MKFMHAAWYLREQGVVIERTTVMSGSNRFYKVYDPATTMPPIWMLPQAVCSLAELAQNENLTMEGYT